MLRPIAVQIEAACADLKGAPDSNTVRGYLNAELTPTVIRDLEHQCNRALIGQWPHWLWSMPLDVAVDLHDECYYGESDDSDPASWVCRGEKRNGTTRFYRCATLAVIRRRIRVTLALAFVHPDDDLCEIVQKLLKSAQKRGVQIGCLYADKQFGTIPILRDLQTQAFAVMVPVPAGVKPVASMDYATGEPAISRRTRLPVNRMVSSRYPWPFSGLSKPNMVNGRRLGSSL